MARMILEGPIKIHGRKLYKVGCTLCDKKIWTDKRTLQKKCTCEYKVDHTGKIASNWKIEKLSHRKDSVAYYEATCIECGMQNVMPYGSAVRHPCKHGNKFIPSYKNKPTFIGKQFHTRKLVDFCSRMETGFNLNKGKYKFVCVNCGDTGWRAIDCLKKHRCKCEVTPNAWQLKEATNG